MKSQTLFFMSVLILSGILTYAQDGRFYGGDYDGWAGSEMTSWVGF